MNNSKSDFTQGSILGKLIPFMMPILGALILQAAYGAVDLLVVGRFGTTEGLSAVSTGSQVLNLVTFVITQFAMGVTVLIARYIGEKRPEQIGALIGGAIVVFTMISVVLFVVMIIFAALLVSGRKVQFLGLACLPVVMIVEYILCLGIALIVASLTVYLRDLQYILGILVMALQYMTPVMYGSDMVPDWAMPIFRLNPMTPVIEIYRDILYYGNVPQMSSLLLALFIGIVFIIVGELLFKKLQKGFAENF